MARRAAERRLVSADDPILTGVMTHMVKPEWGTKRTCPKCSTRFYDLGNDDPVHCIECGTDFDSGAGPEVEAADAVRGSGAGEGTAADADLEAEDLAIDEEEEPSADEEVDLATGDDDLGVATGRRGRRRLESRARSLKFPVCRQGNIA